MLDKNNYFIKEGYKSRSDNNTYSTSADDLYWDETRVFMSKFYQYAVYQYARKLVKKHGLTSVVDVGCGVASKLMELIYPVCNNVTGIDQKEAIDIDQKLFPQGTFIIDNLEQSKGNIGQFDLVICADVIEHMTDPDMLLTYIKSLCHPDTFILISTPERNILRGEDNMESLKPEHVREWNQEELAAYLEDRGFEVLDHQITPFIKFSFNKQVRDVRKHVKNRCGTVNTNQLVLCKLK